MARGALGGRRTGGRSARGAQGARARGHVPFLASNIVDNATGSRILWPNMPPVTLVDVAGIKVGIIGVSTESTPHTTMPANFAGLRISPPAQAIAEWATTLRAQGARVIIATMHIGSSCKDLDHPEDDSSCEKAEELFGVLHDLPKATVDVIVAGHTHAGIAHKLAGIAVIESFASGHAFGRVDVHLDENGKVSRCRSTSRTRSVRATSRQSGRDRGLRARRLRGQAGPSPIPRSRRSPMLRWRALRSDARRSSASC